MKKNIYRTGIVSIFLAVLFFDSGAQNRLQGDREIQYKRSSLYSMLVAHPQMRYASQIDYVYLALPTPEKYENHDLNVRRVEALKAKQVTESEISNFLDRNAVARRLVAKWFDRDSAGNFNVGLIAERGNYNASEMDVQQARMSKRGLVLLSDAGEQLIGNTFVTVNDIVYVDKEKQAQAASAILGVLAGVALAVATSGSDSEEDSDGKAIAGAIAGAAALGSIVADNLAGFTVKVRTHLFRLNWNDSIASRFYSEYWIDKNTPQAEREMRRLAFEKTNLFTLEYVGNYDVKSEKTVLKGLYSNEDIIRQVCVRALDRNIVGLQKKYEVFKVKTPVTDVQDGRVMAKIGMKEGLTAASRFEVLQAVERDGKTVYRRVGTIAPERKQLWDNRFMAFEEQTKGSELTATMFKTLTGGPFYPGMLIRQLK